MPRLKTETFGGGDQSWLGSTHGLRNARTVDVNLSAFAGLYPNGYIPSGYPVAEVSGLLVPYDKTEATTTGAGVLAGFILTDQPVVGTSNFPAPLFYHGTVVAANVPLSGFVAPAATAKKLPTVTII